MRGNSLRAWLLGGLIAAGILAGMVYVDRVVADYVDRTLAGTPLASWAARLLSLLPAVLVLALVLAGTAEGVRDRSKPSVPGLRTLWLGLGSAALALLIAVGLKLLIGRGDAAPTYTVYRIYGLRLLHGGRGYEAFPSATTAGATAFVTVLWLRISRARFTGAGVLLAVLAAIVATNGHWVTDVLAGAVLGALVARGVVQASARIATS